MILVIFRNLTILLDPVIIVMLPNLVILKNMKIFVNKGISGYSKEFLILVNLVVLVIMVILVH